MPAATLPEGWQHALEGIVRGLWREVGWRLSPEVAEDCRQEARLCLWRARERLAGLPDGDRQRYAATCIRRAVRRVLRVELRWKAWILSLDGGNNEPDRAAQTADPDTEGTTGAAEWLTRLERERLADRLRQLAPRDQVLLYHYYVLGMTDAEIGQAAGRSRTAVKQQRHRLVQSLRRHLHIDVSVFPAAPPRSPAPPAEHPQPAA